MAHGVIVESAVSDAHQDAHAVHEGCRAFDHMEAGLQYCEERFLEVHSCWWCLPLFINSSATPLEHLSCDQIC